MLVWSESNYFVLKVMTYNLSEINSGRLKADSFNDYKFNMWYGVYKRTGEGNLF